MNNIKKYAGLLWMLMGPLVIFLLIKTAATEIAKHPVIDTKIQWGIFVIVFFPIMIGLTIFGYYAFKGEYDRLPESSADIPD